MKYVPERLIQLLTEGAEAHPDSEVFLRLIAAIKAAKGLPDKSVLAGLLQPTSAEELDGQEPDGEQPSPVHDTSDEKRDWRCTHLTMSGVRAFPPLTDGDTDRFGIDLSDTSITVIGDRYSDSAICTARGKGNPVSTIILGHNGAGKTSIFTALEAVSIGHSTIADVHGYESDDDQVKFLQHGGGTSADPKITLLTTSAPLYYPNRTVEAIVPAFFCSEYDIQQLERAVNHTGYVANQVGHGPTLELYNSLKEVIADGDEVPAGQDMAPLREIAEFIGSRLSKYLKTLSNLANEILPAMMAGFLDTDCTIVTSCENLSFKVTLKISDPSSEDLPRRYFNTFRFKMFVVGLKVALACCAKKMNGINFPVVIDDVFDASDFTNKGRIRDFIRSLVEQHDKVSKAEGFADKPLQLIFLTQDDIIGRNIYQGIKSSDTDMRVKFCRLYSAKEADKDDDLRICRADGSALVQYRRVTTLINSNF